MDEHSLGSHRLGPHVVGQRVVIRHLLSDGRASDVLGTCLSWTDTDVVVDRDQPGSGETGPLRIPVATIVTGKPVPPRASVRSRVSAREVEGRTTTPWRDLETADVGEWTLRATRRPEGARQHRPNSLLAMGDPGTTAEQVTSQAVDFYTARGRTPLAQAVVGSEEESTLLRAGWQPLASGAGHCQLASVARALRATRARGQRDAPPEATYSEQDGRLGLALGGTLARGHAVVDGDWVGIHDVYVLPDRRRAGLGTAVMAELLDWGASLGATTAWLHVETGCTAAVALYDQLGFRTHHTYGFLTR